MHWWNGTCASYCQAPLGTVIELPDVPVLPGYYSRHAALRQLLLSFLGRASSQGVPCQVGPSMMTVQRRLSVVRSPGADNPLSAIVSHCQPLSAIVSSIKCPLFPLCRFLSSGRASTRPGSSSCRTSPRTRCRSSTSRLTSKRCELQLGCLYCHL